MDPKQVQRILAEVCADLDRRAARTASAVGGYIRPLGLGVALGLGGMSGCASSADGTDARLSSSADAYGVAMLDVRRESDTADGGDARVSFPVDAYGVAMPDAGPETNAADTRGLIDIPSDLYGLASPDVLPAEDGVDTRPLIDAPKDMYGIIADVPGHLNPDGGLDASPVDTSPVDGQTVDGGNNG
jgi:hypothetical protein